MPVITKISTQQKNKDRYNIFLDEKFAFSVDEDILIKHGLKKGLVLDDFMLTEIAYQDDIRKSYNLALNHLAHRMRSEQEIRTYLKGKEIEEIIIDEVIHKLYDYQFLNDYEYALAFVRTQKNTTDKGRDLVRRELQERGIAPQTIDVALEEYPEEDEIELAITLCEKAVQKNKRDSSRIMKQKLEQHLVRKGFSYSTIAFAIGEVDMVKEEDAELIALRSHAEKAHRKYKNLKGFEYEQKMKQTLYRKGFSMELIGKVLSEMQEE